VRAALPERPGALRPAEVLPHQLAVRQSVHGALQALRAERGRVREEVLQPGHDPLLRRGRLLSQEPLVLREREHADVLSRGTEVRDPDPAR
jgi:hypothetical protein